jgi:hypothetical protein
MTHRPCASRTTVVAASHLSAALKAGRYPVEQITQAQQQAQDLIITLKEIIKDMQTGDRTSRRSTR